MSTKKPRKKARTAERVTCLICGKQYKRLSASHLKTHGYTAARYARVFGMDASPPSVSRALSGTYVGSQSSPSSARQAPPGELVRLLGGHIVADPAFVTTMADEVASYIIAGPLRDRLRQALLGLISARLELHGQAVARLDAVNRELGEEWRVAQGGEDGGPTPTKDLLGIAQQTLQEIRTGEDLVLKAVKLAIDEAKTPPAAVAAGSPLDAYSGQDEVIDVPASISPAERETVRNLLSALASGATARARMVDAEQAKPADVVSVSDQDSMSAEQPEMPAVSEPEADEPF